MANRIWNIDGQETISSNGAVVKWDDHKFFTIHYNGEKFNGEILEDKKGRH